MNVERVLVVGAGLAGALLASTLTRKGVSVDLIEKAQQFAESDGAGLVLTGNGSRMLHALGHKDIKANARRIRHIDLRDPSGSTLTRIDCKQSDKSPFLSFKYSTLREMLRDNVPVKFGVSVESLRLESSPKVLLTDGCQRSYDLVVGADGVHSTLRKQVFGPDLQAEMRQFSGFRFLTPTPPNLKQPVTFLGNGLTMLLVPLNNGETYCGAGPIEAQRLRIGRTPVETLQQSYKKFLGAAADIVASLHEDTRFIPSRFWTVKQPTWVSDSCVLIGDAAHAMPPTLSQGASMAFEDVFVLVSCLEHHSEIGPALLEFQTRRRKRVDYVQDQSVARMYANQTLEPHAAATRLKISSLFGAQATMTVWEKLSQEHP